MLAEDLRGEYQLLTGGPLDIFWDKDALAWGDDWRSEIETALSGATFFVPVLSATYFTRPECRRELLRFAEHANSRGVDELLLPVLYSPVQQLEDDSEAADEALRLVEARQWVDWRTLRLEERSSAAYRKGVHALASRLAQIMRNLTSPEGVALSSARTPDVTGVAASLQGGTGLVDLVAAGGTPLTELERSIGDFEPCVDRLTELTEAAKLTAQSSNERGYAVAGRLRAATSLTDTLETPANEVLALGVRLTQVMTGASQGIRLMLDVADRNPIAVLRDPEAGRFLARIQAFAEEAAALLSQLERLFEFLEEHGGYSRELRHPLRNMLQGIQSLRDAAAAADEWGLRTKSVLAVPELG